MATVSRENIGLLNDKITVQVEKTDYLPSFEKALKNYSKQANIPGFRKGMVPVGMVKKMYGQSVFTEEVLRSVEKQLTDYMTNEKLEIFAQPLPLPENDAANLDVNNPAPYTFAFEVGLKPAVNAADLGTAKVKRYNVEITDKMINDEVERLQTRHGKMTDPEAVTGDDNVLNVTFIETDAAGNELEGGVRKDNSLLVKYFAEDFRKNLIGKKANDTVSLQLGKAFGETEKEWILNDLGLAKGQTADEKHFKLEITKVGLIEKAEFNEEFFNTAFPGREIKSEADLRNAIKEDIQKYWDAQARNQIYDQLYHYLIDQTKMEFPEGFLKRWMETGGEKPKTSDEVAAEYPSFANSLKWTLIVDQLVKDHSIEVKPEDIREAAKAQLFSYMGSMGAPMDLDQPWVNDYVERMMKDRKFVEDTFHRIQTDKVFEAAEQKVAATDTPITQEAFVKMTEEHHHHH
ncbi:trigger factor [Pinibacter aurantiacus]|uniref:Trigger factor n=1 Tax=Pinibacter aurantiacus TaxID=2851599 RepID=A0A9E2W7K4_9BACT|nr:trigger factor [Pinibacter aurantiacus]MBV4356432.1 trigger factor [Pinibacter aurantiacus]